MNSTPHPQRQTGALHRGRIPAAGARYFVTIVTAQRRPWLWQAEAREGLLHAWRGWHAEGRGCILAATVMPDHAHVLFEQGSTQPLGQAVARWKADVRRGIGHADTFQRDFWEHRLRSGESAEDYALYVFLNPYRAGLVGAESRWPGWWAPEVQRFRFGLALRADGTPPREWIEWPDERFAALATGE